MSSSAISRSARLHELGRRAFFTTIGGTIFAVLGAYGLLRWGGYSPYVVVGVLAIVLVRASMLTLRRAGSLGREPSRGDTQRGWYRIITGLEYVGIFAVAAWCSITNHIEWLAPLVLVVSGLHFLALGAALRVISAFVKGILLCLVATLTVLLLKPYLPAPAAPDHRVLLWWVASGFMGALIAWTDVVIAVVSGIQLSRAGALAES